MDSTAVSDSRIGSVLQGRYRILQRLAAGGMGVVYRAERLELGRAVAIKFLHPWVAAEPSFQRRFQLEAQAMSRLSHPCCVSVIDFGVEGDAPYLVMDFVTGKTLRELLREEGPPSVRRALGLARQLLAGLAHAHAQGVIHRDVKPDNIVLTEATGLGDQVRILDFGLARLRDSVTGLSTGLVMGTPSYMAPEQTRAQQADARTDVYAVGVLLFELLTGSRPFEGEEVGEVMRKHQEEPPPALASARPGVDFPAELDALISRAMAKKPEERFQSAADFAAALDGLLQGAGVTPTPLPRAASPEAGVSHDAPTREVDAEVPTLQVQGEAPTLRNSVVPTRATRPQALGTPQPAPLASAPPSQPEVAPSPPAPQPVTSAPPSQPDVEPGAPAPRPVASAPPSPPAVALTAAPSLPSPEAPRPRLSKGPLVALGAAGVLLLGVGAALLGPQGPDALPAAHGTPAPTTEPQADAPAARTPARPEPQAQADAPAPRAPAAQAQAGAVQPEELPGIAQAERWVRQKQRDRALRELARLRAQHPRSAYVPYLEGQVNFDNLRWMDGLASYGAAIRNNPAYRSDPTLIRSVLRCLVSDGYHSKCGAFLLKDIGEPARPFLEEAAREDPYANVRPRAAALLRRLPARR